MPGGFEALVRSFASLPPGISPNEAKDQAERLVAVHGAEAVNVALKCQDALMEAGNELAALTVLQVITAIWEIEDGR